MFTSQDLVRSVKSYLTRLHHGLIGGCHRIEINFCHTAEQVPRRIMDRIIRFCRAVASLQKLGGGGGEKDFRQLIVFEKQRVFGPQDPLNWSLYLTTRKCSTQLQRHNCFNALGDDFLYSAFKPGSPGTSPCYGPALDTYRLNPFALRVKVLNYLLPLRGFLRIMKHNQVTAT